MPLHVVLLTGPLVGASSWFPTSDCLRTAGVEVQIPDVLAATPSRVPRWRDWSAALTRTILTTSEPLIFVAHSSASTLAAELATMLPARGVIVVDGEVPPKQGPAAPVRPALHDFIRTLADDAGLLPPWSRWFGVDPQRASLVGIDRLMRDEPAFADFEAGLPRMTTDWFDDAITLKPWDHVPAGYIQTSRIYDHAVAEAEKRHWPIIRLQGTHLHPTLEPDEMADAILGMIDQLAEEN